jgi:hypothetical protein
MSTKSSAIFLFFKIIYGPNQIMPFRHWHQSDWVWWKNKFAFKEKRILLACGFGKVHRHP